MCTGHPKYISFASALALLLFIFFVQACHSGSEKIDFKVHLQSDGSLKITGPQADVLGEIGRDTGAWPLVLPVYRMPADTDMKDFQPVLQGKYKVDSSAVIFVPDTPFAAGKIYFLRCFDFGNDRNGWNLLKNRRRLGAQPYTDLIFKK